MKKTMTKSNFTVKEANATLPLISKIAQDIKKHWREITDWQQKVAEENYSDEQIIHIEAKIEQLVEKINNCLKEIAQVGALTLRIGDPVVAFPCRQRGYSAQLLWFFGDNEVTKWKWPNNKISEAALIRYDF